MDRLVAATTSRETGDSDRPVEHRRIVPPTSERLALLVPVAARQDASADRSKLSPHDGTLKLPGQVVG